MIVISYGMVKSASTFCFQITHDMLKANGHDQVAIRSSLPPRWQNQFQNLRRGDARELHAIVPRNAIMLIKTHSLPPKDMKRQLSKGIALATATIRDPRDCVVSYIDAVAREVREGTARRFSTPASSPMEAAKIIESHVKHAIKWLNLANVLPIPYDLLASDPHTAAERIAMHVGIDVEIDEILRPYLQDRSLIWEYNVGKPGRYLDVLDKKDQKTLDEVFQPYMGQFSKFLNSGI